jgi:hypothetical protein
MWKKYVFVDLIELMVALNQKIVHDVDILYNLFITIHIYGRHKNLLLYINQFKKMKLKEITSLDHARIALTLDETTEKSAQYLSLVLLEKENNTMIHIQKAIRLLQEASKSNNCIEIDEDDIDLLNAVYFVKKVANFFQACCWINADPSGIHLK